MALEISERVSALREQLNQARIELSLLSEGEPAESGALLAAEERVRSIGLLLAQQKSDDRLGKIGAGQKVR